MNSQVPDTMGFSPKVQDMQHSPPDLRVAHGESPESQEWLWGFYEQLPSTVEIDRPIP